MIRLLSIALWAFLLRGTIDDSDRPWFVFWLVLETAMLVGWIAYTYREHDREVEKARGVRLWRTR